MFRQISSLVIIRFVSHTNIPRTCSLHNAANTDINYFQNMVKSHVEKQPSSKTNTTNVNSSNKKQKNNFDNKNQHRSYGQQTTSEYFQLKQKNTSSSSSAKFTSYNTTLGTNKWDDQNKHSHSERSMKYNNYVSNKSRISTYNNKKSVNQINDNDDKTKTSKFNSYNKAYQNVTKSSHDFNSQEEDDMFENEKDDLTLTGVETKTFSKVNKKNKTTIYSKDKINVLLSNKQDETKNSNSIPLEVLVQPDLHDLYTNEEIHESIEQYIRNIRPVVLRSLPYDMAYLINESETLKRFVEMGVDIYRWGKSHAKVKYTSTLDFERDCSKHIVFLHDKGIQNDILAQFLSFNPWIFSENINDLQTRIHYLESKEFKSDMIQHIITKAPYWLNLSTKTVDNKLSWFQKKFHLSVDEIRTIVCKAPKLITLPLKDISDTYFNMKEFLNFTEEQLKELLIKYPKLFQYDFKVIEFNFDFLINQMNIKQEQFIEYPPILKQSYQRLRTRCLYLKSIGRDQFNSSEPNFISLKALCLSTDELFCQQVLNTTVKQYRQFSKTNVRD